MGAFHLGIVGVETDAFYRMAKDRHVVRIDQLGKFAVVYRVGVERRNISRVREGISNVCGVGTKVLSIAFGRLTTGALDHVRAEGRAEAVSYTHLRAHETVLDLVCR